MKTLYLKHIIRLAVLVAISILVSCQDDALINPTFSEGDVNISAEIKFKNPAVVDVDMGSRAGAPVGSKFKTINSLYIFFFDTDGNIIKNYSGTVDNYKVTDVEREKGTLKEEEQAETVTPSATFNRVVRSGVYYIYAVANIDAEKLEGITTIEELRNFELTWDPENIDNNLAMFGVFKNTGSGSTGNTETTIPVDNTGFEDDIQVTLARDRNRIHSWMRRATSKVTVAFDGSELLDDVTVYIHSARLVDVAEKTLLGRVIPANKITTTSSSFIINYGEGSDPLKWPNVDNRQSLTSYTESDGTTLDMHSEWARALPCYENLQGTREGTPKLQDSNNDGIIDNPDAEKYKKDGVDLGTYLEVEGFYESKNKNYISRGPIKYRFMLGMNHLNDFDVMRNHHYRITMSFKGFGNEVDWHVEYNDIVFDATAPVDVNYQGKFWVPDYTLLPNNELQYPNKNHNFTNQNTITVTSFTGSDNNVKFSDFEILYKTDEDSEFSLELPSWFEEPKYGNISADQKTRDVTFVVKPDYNEIDIDARLSNNTTKGEEAKPYNLASSGGTYTNAKPQIADIEETANCYIVDAKGHYIFPVVYGNSYIKTGKNTSAYTADAGLTTFKNHLNAEIKDPFIIANNGCAPHATNPVELIWQDEKNLIKNLAYDPAAYDNKGGISFEVDGNIQQGNALIAIRDTKGQIMWSWHIWITDLSFDPTIEINHHNGQAKYNLMNFNLGWCSDKEGETHKKLRYYPRRSCEIKIRNKENGAEIVYPIVRYPHTLMPRGNNPSYQWGRKDPFPGLSSSTLTNPGPKESEVKYNKVLYTYNNGVYRAADKDPQQFWDSNISNDPQRKPTTEVLGRLIYEPYNWHNPPRIKDVNTSNDFTSNNTTYPNLWSVGDGRSRGVTYKTVYDPCPPGYQVCHSDAFSQFTTTGWGTYDPKTWLDVAEKNMTLDYYGGTIDEARKQVIEFYTDDTRLESITIPLNGYRDWDAEAQVYWFGRKGYIWTNTNYSVNSNNNSTYLEISRYYKDGWDWETYEEGVSENIYTLRVVRPANGFLNCDGCPVRPIAY